MADTYTKISDLIDPEVMGDVVSARIPNKLRVAPFAKVDDTLAGVPGDTITVPAYAYIGDAADVAEGEAVSIEKMTTSVRRATVKKAMKGIGLTDEAVLSGYGNPVGEANTQLAMAIAAKIDNDCMEVLQGASLCFNSPDNPLSYTGLVDALDLFEEEQGTDKVIFVHPKQLTALRKSEDFLSADKYQSGVMVSGEIGMIAGCRVVPSKKVPLQESWYKPDDAGSVTVNSGNLEEVRKTLPGAKENDKVTKVDTPCYFCPIVKLESDPETEDALPALTIYRKRQVNVETERKPKIRTTEITADEFYVAVLSNEAKVVLGKFKA
ncbi:MAG: N4-gp56 family major capsid protein [Gemmiger sp.]|uniref:N4-gp56 family major capsid protein n=1 Tax=Gemmiger sp. TaxID=2049027 RepID=UPI002E789664|nr:N4-gp56 family major capsid protein [Gemmiger sp.]MEE0802066.1 N4-gp56 family major capsid protein [Gemmiger sp.]